MGADLGALLLLELAAEEELELLDVVQQGLLLSVEEGRIAGEALGEVAELAHFAAEGFDVSGEIGVGLEEALNLGELATAFAEGAVHVGGVGEAAGGKRSPVAAVGGVASPAIAGSAVAGTVGAAPAALAVLLTLT